MKPVPLKKEIRQKDNSFKCFKNVYKMVGGGSSVQAYQKNLIKNIFFSVYKEHNVVYLKMK